MKKYSNNIVLTLLLISAVIIIASCGKKDPEEKDKVNSTETFTAIKFVPKELVKSYKDCVPGSANCSYIRLNYVEASEGDLKDKINQIINFNLLSAYEMPDKNQGNVKLMMETFMKDYKSISGKFPPGAQVWTIDFIADVYGETDKIISLMFSNSSFLGGTHPDNHIKFVNISKSAGDTLGLTDIFGQGFDEKLNAIIDKKFREMKGLKPEDDLSQKGGLLENRITYNHNFAIGSNKSLEFYYNPYEIAPYTEGPIIIKLNMQDVAGLLTGAGPLN